jgi:predicted transcriptional regulator of viral defense system
MQHMDDTTGEGPDHDCLFWTASTQQGYFSTAQAADCGFSRFLLSRGVDTGRYLRIRRGLYRLRAYPTSPREEVVAAWLALGKDSSVVSHESALELLDLSDVIPNAIHLTVPRSRRNLPKLPGVAIHTRSKPFGPREVIVRDGIRLTSAGRTILDAAEMGTAPEQIEMAIEQAIRRGLIQGDQLATDARSQSARVQRLVTGALSAIRT